MRQPTANIMSNSVRGKALSAAVCAAAMAFSARSQAPEDHIVTRVSAEVLVRPAVPGTEPGAAPGAAAKLQAAERVVSGDVLIYTVEVRNTGRYAVESAVVVQPVPNHTVYVADSAVGPGAEVDYSVDGGRTFDKPDNLQSPRAAAAAGGQDAIGHTTRAAAGEYTQIRWRLHNRLKANSIAFVRFRAQVK